MEKIKKISIEDKEYPEQLKSIDNPPNNLFYKGNLPQAKSECFAIVGTRRYSSYGKQVALEISSDLTDAGLIIISGLAPGIDTFAHLAVVEKNRPTVAVLGTGIDEKSIYPKSNIELSRQIIKTGGCLISEYPPGTPGSQITFPQRNRIISGLSLGILVIEAKQKSGTLITANWAKKQKKKIFAIPGQIYSSNSKGCHYLIKNGAKLAENANDILLELDKVPDLSFSFLKSRRIIGDTKEEDLILKSLKEESLHIDKIIEKTKLPTPLAMSNLANLEIKGKIRNLGANIFALER